MADKPHKLHALESFEIEVALLGILPSSPPDGVVQKAQPTTGRTISIKQLMQGAMRNAQCAMTVILMKSMTIEKRECRNTH